MMSKYPQYMILCQELKTDETNDDADDGEWQTQSEMLP